MNLNEDINDLLNEIEVDRFKVLRAYCDKTSVYNISDFEWNSAKNKYPNASKVEDNDYMSKHYLIIDSEGNLSKNNLHLTENSLLNNSVDECLENLTGLEGPICQ